MKRLRTKWNHSAPEFKAEKSSFNLKRAWRGTLAGLLLFMVTSAPAQVYSIGAGDIVAANYRAGDSTVVRVNPQTGTVRRLGAFNYPTDIAVSPEGYLYVSELGGQIKRVNLTNGVETVINPNTSLTQVWGLALAPNGDLYVTDSSSNAIIRINPTSGVESVVAQGGQMSTPTGIDFLDADHVVVASRGNNRVVAVSLLDHSQTTLAQGANGIDQPWGISVFDGNIYVGAHDSQLLFRITGTTVVNILPAWSPKLGGGPFGIGTDLAGNIVVGVSGGLVGPFALEQRDPQGNPLPVFSGNYIGEITGVEVSRISVLADQQTNTPPQLTAVGVMSTDEGAAMSFVASGSDGDWPLQELTYSLIGDVPAGASLAANGVFSWKPTETQGPSTNVFTMVVADDGTPSLSSTQSFTVVVREINTAPVVTPVGNKLAAVGSLLSFQVSATDPDLPSQGLTLSLAAGAPLGAGIAPDGNFVWTPDNVPGPGNYVLGVVVTDNGEPQLSSTNFFSVLVREANQPPVFGSLTNRTVNENSQLFFQLVATDSNQPPQALSYGLAAAAPTGVAVSSNGIFTWTPTEAQGPSTNQILVRVTDNGTPPLSATGSVMVVVNEVNRAPTLTVVPNRIVHLGESVAFTAQAQDADLPAQALTFTLEPGAPAGATISAAGEFFWHPTPTQAPSSNAITITVSDSGLPPLRQSRTFGVEVRGGYALNVGDILVANYGADSVVKIDGQTGAPLTLGNFASPTDVGLSTNGELFVSEQGGAVERLDLRTGVISLVNPGSSLTDLRALAVGASGKLYVAAAGNDSIVRIDPATGVETLVTQGGLISGPYGIAMMDADHLIVSSFYNNAIVVVALTNNSQALLASGGGINQPWGVAAADDGQVAISGYGSHSLQILSGGTPTNLVTMADRPSGIAVAKNGDLVATINGAFTRVTSFSAEGVLLTNYLSGLTGFCMGVEVVTAPFRINQPPVASPDTAERDPAGGVTVFVASLLSNDADADGDPISFLGASAVSANGGTVISNGGWLSYTPAAGFTNLDTFAYTISDGVNGPVTGTVTVNIRVNNQPAPQLTIGRLGDGQVTIQIQGTPDRTYQIEYVDDPSGLPWQPLGTVTADPFGNFQFLDSGQAIQRFYRSVFPPP